MKPTTWFVDPANRRRVLKRNEGAARDRGYVPCKLHVTRVKRGTPEAEIRERQRAPWMVAFWSHPENPSHEIGMLFPTHENAMECVRALTQ